MRPSTGDLTARLWNIDNPRQPTVFATLSSPGASVANVFFTPGRQRVAVASNEHLIRFFDTDLDGAARRICDLAGTPITREEWSAQFDEYPYQPPCG